jgi:hypothetical protein
MEVTRGFKREDFIGFVVTGFKTNGKRFKTLQYDNSYSGYMTAMCINLYKGRIYGVLKDGKRKLIKYVM